jgi:nitroreductase
MKPGIGDSFQQETKYHRGHLRGGGLDWASKPTTYKRYPSAPKIPLGPPQTEDGAPIWDVLQQRQSIRRFQDAPLQREELSQLLWAAQGVTRAIAYWANVVFVWTAIFERSKWKYGQRAYRYVYLDGGHIAQNVALGAVALGLGSCQVAALYDDEANVLLDVDGLEESTIYMTVVGRPR